MSAETKYLVMEELIGVPAAAIEKAEEQASRIIQIVHGGWTKEEIDRCSLPEDLLDFHLEPTAYELLPPCQERHPEFRPKHTTKPTKESLKLTEKIVSLRAKGLHWHQIAAKVGLSKEAARKRYRSWEEKHPKEFYVTPKDEPENAIELYEPGAEESAAEAALAEEVLKSASQNERGPSKEEQISQLIASMDSQNALNIEILQAVRRQFPGCSLTVADIRARRHL